MTTINSLLLPMLFVQVIFSCMLSFHAGLSACLSLCTSQWPWLQVRGRRRHIATASGCCCPFPSCALKVRQQLQYHLSQKLAWQIFVTIPKTWWNTNKSMAPLSNLWARMPGSSKFATMYQYHQLATKWVTLGPIYSRSVVKHWRENFTVSESYWCKPSSLTSCLEGVGCLSVINLFTPDIKKYILPTFQKAIVWVM